VILDRIVSLSPSRRAWRVTDYGFDVDDFDDQTIQRADGEDPLAGAHHITNEPIVQEFDNNKDGRVDAIIADTDRDGDPDVYQYDSNNDGIMDMTAYDVDDDGDMDQREYDRNGDGKIEEVRLDSDGDGDDDLVQLDQNKDGVLDSLIRDTDNDGLMDRYDKIHDAKTTPELGPNAGYHSA
jgi:hypothetical protein